MSSEPQTPPVSPPRRSARRALAVGLGVLVIGGTGIYAARLVIARQAVDAWLRGQGVEGEMTFRALGPGGLSGALRIGPAAKPDLTAELAEIDYDLSGLWSGEGLRVKAIRLVRPELHARLRNGRLDLGRLDPLVKRLSRTPSSAAQPDIEVKSGRLRLDTEYGPLDIGLDGGLAAGRITRLDATLAPARLASGDLSVATGPGELHLVGRDDRLAVAGALRIPELKGRRGAAKTGEVILTGRLPHPDLHRRRIDGPARITLAASLIEGRLGDRTLKRARLEAELDGRASGPLAAFDLAGALALNTQVGETRIGHGDVEDLSLDARIEDLTWRRADGDRLDGRLVLTGQAGRVRQGNIEARSLDLSLAGPAAADHYGFNLDLAGRADAHGAWRGGAGGDPALRRAVADIRINAPDLRLKATEQTLALAAPRPIRIATPGGGGGQLTAPTLFDNGHGAFRLDLKGPGLPEGRLVASRYDLTPTGFTAAIDLSARGDAGPVRGASLSTAGMLRQAGSDLAYSTGRCATFSAERVALGDEDLKDLAGRLCPGGGPLLVTGRSGWRLRGRTDGLAATVPLLQARITEGAASLDARQGALIAEVAEARIADTAAEARFNPVRVSGPVRLANGAWRAEETVRDQGGRRIGLALITHDSDSGRGRAEIDTDELVFSPGGLEPAALSPKAAFIGRPASGEARFSGRFDWGPEGGSSGGRLDLGHLDFTSPAGAVEGLAGRILFTSLAPLRAAPGQTLTAEKLAVLSGLDQPKITFGLDREAVQVEAGAFGLAGGKVELESFEIPFSGGAWKGAIRFEGVELAELVQASPFAERMALTAKVAGRVPFEVTSEGVRISGGELHAVGPGRITIRRDALTGVTGAGGGATGPEGQPLATEADPYSDFVYQAMEDLAFDTMSAEVASRPGGRLGVIFRIKGRHDPPKKAEIRLSLQEVLTRRIKRKLPLPSGAVVDLTLDSSVNLDQLLSDFAEYQRLRGSRPVHARFSREPPASIP